MANSTVSTLVIDVQTEADKAVAGLDGVADASTRMSNEVASASDKAAKSFGVTADSTDELASKSGQATGALGALSSGFELVGLDKYAAGLQGASLATDFMSGVGDSLNLVLESTAVKSALARVNMIRQAVTSRVVAGATRVWAAGQWVLNAALNANPIGLVVAGVALLVGLLVLAYKRSATFRSAVQAAGRIGRQAIGWVVDAVSSLVRWMQGNLGGAVSKVASVFRLAVSIYTLPFRTVLSVGRDLVSFMVNKVTGAVTTVKSKFSAIGDALSKPFNGVLGVIKDILTAIGKIHVPHVDLNPFNGRTTSNARTVVVDPVVNVTSGSGSPAGRPAGNVTFQTIVQGTIVDPLGTAQSIDTVQRKQARRLGLVVI